MKPRIGAIGPQSLLPNQARCAEPPQATPSLQHQPPLLPPFRGLLRYRGPFADAVADVLPKSSGKVLQNQGCCGVAVRPGGEAIGERAAGFSQPRRGDVP